MLRFKWTDIENESITEVDTTVRNGLRNDEYIDLSFSQRCELWREGQVTNGNCTITNLNDPDIRENNS